MRISKLGSAFIRAHEGFVPKSYLDPVGVLTIGVGFTWGSSSFRKWWGANRPGQKFDKTSTMTAAEADSCLAYLCDAEYGAAVNKFLGSKVVNQHVFDAMCSMVYNCGVGALKWKWAAAVKRGDLKAAADHLRVTATTAKGKTLPGLVRRRQEEADLLLNGRYSGVNVKAPIPIPIQKPEQPANIEPQHIPDVNWLTKLLQAIAAIFKRK